MTVIREIIRTSKYYLYMQFGSRSMHCICVLMLKLLILTEDPQFVSMSACWRSFGSAVSPRCASTLLCSHFTGDLWHAAALSMKEYVCSAHYVVECWDCGKCFQLGRVLKREFLVHVW